MSFLFDHLPHGISKTDRDLSVSRTAVFVLFMYLISIIVFTFSGSTYFTPDFVSMKKTHPTLEYSILLD